MNAKDFPEDVVVVVDAAFPNDDAKGEEVAMPWRDVEQKTWMKIVDMGILDTVNGKSMIIELQKRDGTIIKAWTTKIIEKNITLKNSSKSNKNIYIMSLGEKTSKKSKRMYNNFNIRVQ